jgi:hypothetical protein
MQGQMNLYVDNHVFYQRAKLQLKIPYIRGCAKMTNSDIYSSEQYKHSKSQNQSDFIIFILGSNFR